jgi:YDG domain/GEVED domain/Cadherin domain
LDWIDTSGETGYRIERSTDGVAYTTIGTVGVNIPSYTASSLATGTTYFFRVTPTSAFGDGPSTVLSGGTRMAQVANLAFTAVTGNSIALSWTDLTTETGYQVQRSTNGTTFSTLTTLAAGTVAYTDNTVTPGNEYYYRVLGTNGQSVSLYNLAFTATPTITALPIPWSAQDIGTASGGTGSSRSTTFNSTDSSFKVVSSGTTISGTSDSFRFTHQTLTGDGVVTARVTALEDTAAGSTRFGVMFREALNAGSRYAAMFLRKDSSTAQFSVRTTAGISATVTDDAVRNTPYWVRVSRSGNVFTGFTSSDGTTWTQVGQSTIAMPATVFVGLAASAGTTASLNTATATNVSVIANPILAVTSGNRVYNDSAYAATASMANNTLPAPTVSFVYYSDASGTTVIPAPVKVGTYYVRAVSAANAGNNAAQSPISSFQITPFGLTVSATGQHKVYDGTTVANVVFSDNRFAGDVFTVSGTAAFSSKDIGVAKAVSVLNVSLSGVDALNYTFNTSAATTANINAKTLVATGTAANKVYDGNANANVTISLAGVIAGETVTGSASGLFNNKNVGTGKTVTAGTVTLAGAGAGNYTVGSASVMAANITPFGLTVSAAGQHKTYDGTTDANVVLSDNRIGGDVFSVSATAAFDNKNVGIAKAVSVSNVALSGVDATNYTFNTSAATTADVNPMTLVATGTSSNKVYDGNADASVTISLAGIIAGDTVTGSATGLFNDKNVGTGKTVTAGTVTLGGTDSGNYIVGSASATTADITPLEIEGEVTVFNRVYDGTVDATIDSRTLIGVLPGDTVTYVGGVAEFGDKHVGSEKPVSATGLTLDGPDAVNYFIGYEGVVAASITRKPITSSGTVVSKVYDATTDASVTISLDGVVAGDDVTGTATATFANKNVDTGKPVTIGAISLAGVDNDNYTVGSAPETTADITAKPIVGNITAVNKVFDGTAAATILTRTLSGVFGTDIVDYVGGTATFDSASVGDGKVVTATDLSLSGLDSGNYIVNTTATTTANIEVNSAPTEITISNNLIAENAGSNAVVGTLSFTDPNVGDTAVFSLPTGVLDNGLFNIATDGITLQANSSFDFEALNAYSITVRVTDAGGLSFDKALSIGVTNVNEAPTDIFLSATSAAENLPNGTDVGNFSTNDPDSGNTFTYDLVPVQGNSDDTSFTIIGNTLKTAAVLDFEAKPSYSIRVRSTDQGGLAKEMDFTINVVADTNVQTRDFGDAPLPYPASGGHLAIGPQLGATRDVEAGIQRSAAADGDGSDEDGVLFGIINTALGLAAVNIDLQNATTGRVDGWIDFNGDGDWSDADEQIFANTPVNGGIQTLNYMIPAGAVAGHTIARIRVSSSGALTPIEPASDGEIEDYRVMIGSTPPVVVQKIVNNTNVTRSELTSITVDFDSVIPVQASDFILRNTTTNQTVTGIAVKTQSMDGTTRATLTFTGGPSVMASTHASVAPSLANGAYTLRYLPTETPGNTAPIDEFFRKFGDADGNNLVALTDFATFRSSFGSSVGGANYRTDMDSNRDGMISLTDFAAFRSGFAS